jgi:hypothetical protein
VCPDTGQRRWSQKLANDPSEEIVQGGRKTSLKSDCEAKKEALASDEGFVLSGCSLLTADDAKWAKGRGRRHQSKVWWLVGLPDCVRYFDPDPLQEGHVASSVFVEPQVGQLSSPKNTDPAPWRTFSPSGRV